MTDINKTIEHLKELEAKAVSWKRAHEDEGCCVICDLARSHNYNDAVLAEALRNALPELLAELQRRDARAEKAEAEVKRYVWEDGQGPNDDRPLPEDPLIDATFPMPGDGFKERCRADMEAMRLVGAKRSKRGLVNLVRWLILEKEKAEAERDVLAKEIAKREIMDWYSETEQPGDECRPDYWLEWAEREAASTDN